MKSFAFVRPTTAVAASAALAEPSSVLKANGVDLLDRMKERVDEPDRVVALLDVPDLAGVAATQAGGVKIGAMTTLQALADDPLVRERLPSLAKAAGLAASPQLRRRATVGGNLGQHTRCGYYRHLTFACWKRGAEACPVRADTGDQETAGIFGNGSCASAHPSSLAPVFGSLGAVVHVHGPKGPREVPFPALWAVPERGRATDLALDPAEVITAVEVARSPYETADGYEEVRVKSAFDWALVSAAVRLNLSAKRTLNSGSIWLGSVAPTPHRAVAAEALLTGTLTDALAEKVGAAAAQGATPLAGNAYKVDLVKVAVKRALHEAVGKVLMDQPGDYARRVREALKVRCVHLKTKEAYLGLPGPDASPSSYDTAIWWCSQTCGVFGPDGGTAIPARCERPGRACYAPPIRPPAV